jgi:hypothetical protein
MLQNVQSFKVKISSFQLYIATLTERSLNSAALQVGRLQERTTHRVAHTVAYDGLAPLHPPLQLVWPHAVPVAAQITLIPSRSWYQFIDPGGVNGLVGWGKCELTPCPTMLRIGTAGFEPGSPDLESSALTTRPTRLTLHNSVRLLGFSLVLPLLITPLYTPLVSWWGEPSADLIYQWMASIDLLFTVQQ